MPKNRQLLPVFGHKVSKMKKATIFFKGDFHPFHMLNLQFLYYPYNNTCFFYFTFLKGLDLV